MTRRPPPKAKAFVDATTARRIASSPSASRPIEELEAWLSLLAKKNLITERTAQYKKIALRWLTGGLQADEERSIGYVAQQWGRITVAATAASNGRVSKDTAHAYARSIAKSLRAYAEAPPVQLSLDDAGQPARGEVRVGDARPNRASKDAELARLREELARSERERERLERDNELFRVLLLKTA